MGSVARTPVMVSVRLAVPSVAGVTVAVASTWPAAGAVTTMLALCPLASPRNVTCTAGDRADGEPPGRPADRRLGGPEDPEPPSRVPMMVTVRATRSVAVSTRSRDWAGVGLLPRVAQTQPGGAAPAGTTHGRTAPRAGRPRRAPRAPGRSGQRDRRGRHRRADQGPPDAPPRSRSAHLLGRSRESPAIRPRVVSARSRHPARPGGFPADRPAQRPEYLLGQAVRTRGRSALISPS